MDMGKEEAGMGTDFGDYDNDGKFDITVSNYQTETNTPLSQSRQQFLY